MNRIDQAPLQVQERVGDPRTAREIAAIGRSKQLHIDQIGKIAEMTRNLLLGLVNPQEFLQELVAVGITELVARQIMTEINQKIFIPLRESMKTAATGVSAPAKPAIPQARSQMPPRPTGAPAPSASQPQRYFHLQNKLPTRPAVAPSGAEPMIPKVGPQIQPQKSTLAQVIANAQQRQPAPTKPQSINILPPSPKLEQPPAAPTRPSVPVIAPLPPKTILPQSMLPRPLNAPLRGASGEHSVVRNVLATAVPPINLPGAMPPSDIVAPVKPAPAVSTLPPKPYSADPYREPIE